MAGNMPLYIDPEHRKQLPRVETFYIDDSTCDIEGIPHTLLGAISFYNESLATSAMLEIRKDLGLSIHQELKWNSQAFTPRLRDLITEEILPILRQSEGCLVIAEGKDKQSAAAAIASQLSDFCRSKGAGGFVCRFDKGVIEDSREFDSHVRSLDPPCAGWTEADSAHDQLVQLADLFLGFQKLRIGFGLGQKNPEKLVNVEVYEGVDGEYPLEWYVRLALRHCLWGEVEAPTPRGEPWKNNIGFGVRMISSISDRAKKNALRFLDREFLGCIH
jgi:hypothetical protein